MIPSKSSDQQPAVPESEPGKGPVPAVATPLSLVVSNISQHQSGCSPTCLHEKRIIRRELQKWGKNVVYLVGFESVAQEFLGPKRWKRVTSGLPCPPPSDSGGRRERLAQLSPGSLDRRSDPEPRKSGTTPGATCDDVAPRGADEAAAGEPVDWDPLNGDCFNCALRKIKSKHCLLNSEVPDSTDVIRGKVPDSSPVMKQSIERMCSCDPQEGCASCIPASPASCHEQHNGQEDDEAPQADDVNQTSIHLHDQLSSHKVRHSDQSNSSHKARQTNPNHYLLQQLKKQLIFPSINATNSSCDQPLDLSLNSTRAQQLHVASSNPAAKTAVSETSAKGQFDQNSLLKVVSSGASEVGVAPAVPKRSRETTWKRNYTEEELNQALQDILGGKLGTRRAAVIYGIPRSTLRNKVYKLGKGSPVGPGRLPGRRPKSALTAAASLSPSSAAAKVPPAGKVSEGDHVSSANASLSAIGKKKEPQVMPKTRVGRKSTKISRNQEESHLEAGPAASESLKQMLRENIFNKNHVSNSGIIDRNNNSSLNSRDAAPPAALLNSPAFMSILPLMMMNHNQFGSAPDTAGSIPESTATSYTQTSNLFSQQAGVGDQMIAQSNHHQALSMLSTLDPAAISAIAPLICSYLFNFERLVLASTAASAASASLSATATSLSAHNVKPTSASSTTGLLDYSSYPPTDPFFLDYIQRLRGSASESAASDVLTSASAQHKYLRQESSDGPDDVSAEMEDEEDPAGQSDREEGSGEAVKQSVPNGSLSEYDMSPARDLRVDPVILKIPSLKSKKSNARSIDQGIRCPDAGLEGSECRSILERNLLSVSSNRSNSYASSINSEESSCDQSVTSGGKKGSRTGSASKRSNGCKSSSKSADTSCSDAAGIKNRPKRGRYRNYDREALDKAVLAVQSGEMSVHRAGTFYGVPHSTLEYKVKQRHLLREKKRPATSTATAASSNNSSASSPPPSAADGSSAHPLQDPDQEEPDEKKFRKDSSFESLVANDL